MSLRGNMCSKEPRVLIGRRAVGARHSVIGQVYPEACAVVDVGKKLQRLVGVGVDLQTRADREKILESASNSVSLGLAGRFIVWNGME